MAIKKLEWLADYKEYSLGSILVERTPGKEEYKTIEYKKGQIINVEAFLRAAIVALSRQSQP